MGWYQWQLFIVVGFGWANDNLWPIVTSLICKFSNRPRTESFSGDTNLSQSLQFPMSSGRIDQLFSLLLKTSVCSQVQCSGDLDVMFSVASGLST